MVMGGFLSKDFIICLFKVNFEIKPKMLTDMHTLFELLQQEFYGNTLFDYSVFGIILMLGFLFKRFISKRSNRLIFKFFGKYKSDISIEHFSELLHKPVSYTILLIVAFVAFSQLQYPPEWKLVSAEQFGIRMLISRLFTLSMIVTIMWILLRFCDIILIIMLHRAEESGNKFNNQLIPFFIDFLKITVVIFSILVILGTVFNVNVATLVAGLGIGGLAIALAAKESLENLMGSFTIFLEKPFVVGDMVRVGNVQGTVEKVGFRSTRLRTLEKSFVTLPNRIMVSQELDNLSMRTFRRVNFNLGLTYQSSAEQIKNICNELQVYLDSHPKTNNDSKVRFSEFGASSLDIMVLYFVDTEDFTEFLDVKEEINFQIMRIVKKQGADFAFPSTSVYLEKMPLVK